MNANEYIKAVMTLAGAQYLQVRFDHIRFLKGNETAALILAYVINRIRLNVRNDADQRKLVKNDLWCRCPLKTVLDELGMGTRKVRTALAVLVEEGLIETDHRKGNNLWIKLNVERLQALENESDMPKCSNAKKAYQKCQKSISRNAEKASPIYTNNPSKKLLSTPSQATEGEYFLPSSNGKAKQAVRSPKGFTAELNKEGKDKAGRFGKNLAAEFELGLRKLRKLMRRPPKNGEWARLFNKLAADLAERDGISLADAKRHARFVIRDGLANMKDRFQPKTYSAKAVVEKFMGMEDATERRKNEDDKKASQDAEYEAQQRSVW